MENNNYLCTENQTSATMDLKESIKKQGYSVSQMAEEIGIMQQSLSRSINNKNVTQKQIEQMAEVCGITDKEFLGCAVPKEITIKIDGVEYTYVLVKE